MSELVKVNLHGNLGKEIGELWELSVSSVSAAINAIQQLTEGKLYKYLHSKSKVKFRVLINNEDFISEKKLDVEDLCVEDVKNSNLCIKIKDLKTIDIVPIIEGSDGGFFNAILGGILIVVGAVLALTGNVALGVGLIMIGAGLLASGITALLSKPPTFDDFRTIGAGAKVSYLFDGPQNVTKEGGPVPIGYGRLLVGSQVIGASYVIRDSIDKKKDTGSGGSQNYFYVWSEYYVQPNNQVYYEPLKKFTFFNPSDKDKFWIWAGYYELNEAGTEIRTYKPAPDSLLYLIDYKKNLDKAKELYNNGFPEPQFNPYPTWTYKNKPYPFF